MGFFYILIKIIINIDYRIDIVKIVYFGIACFVIYLIYTTLTAPRNGNEGDRRRGLFIFFSFNKLKFLFFNFVL